MKILITGGAGFVGSHLALAFKAEDKHARIIVMDNLKRRGSELNLELLKNRGIVFVHGDIRQRADFEPLTGPFDLMIEASAEPSVLAGLQGSPNYLLETNLCGTLHCLEFARRHVKRFIFLSTSRVYSIGPLREIKRIETASRFKIAAHQQLPGVGPEGIAENFPTHLPRSLYGASKLASEMMVQEYCHAYGLNAIINRCGVIAGPGQFGKTDQGVFTLWVARHVFRKPLTYTGYQGKGKQVRDLLHPQDLYALIIRQIVRFEPHSGGIFNIGGQMAVSTSLREWTALCERVTANRVDIRRSPATSPVDIPIYISDCQKARRAFGWKPSKSPEMIVDDIARWIYDSKEKLASVFN